ncbi:MAG: hypothetical protein MK085_05290, partial [Phycisphaerales bacterium]|nr:hypothetical protein [Phycisphaerales bacterium]
MSTGNDSLDWHIAGNGAVGSAIAWHLQDAGQKVCLLTRSPQPDPMALTYRFMEEASQGWSCPTRHTPVEGMSISRLIVATKAFSVAKVLQTWEPTLTPDARVYFMQNGRDFLPEGALGSSRRAIFVVNGGIAAFRNSPSDVIQTANNPVWIGEQSGSAKPSHPDIADDLVRLDATDLRFSWTDDIEAYSWRKVAAN